MGFFALWLRAPVNGSVSSDIELNKLKIFKTCGLWRPLFIGRQAFFTRVTSNGTLYQRDCESNLSWIPFETRPAGSSIMKFDDTKGKLQTKLTQLEIHPKRTEQVLNLRSVEAIARHFWSNSIYSNRKGQPKVFARGLEDRSKGRFYSNGCVELWGWPSVKNERWRWSWENS